MENFILDLGIVLIGASLLSIVAIIIRQPIIIAYILCGVIVGPWGIGLIKHVEFIEIISHLGITLLLFLAGLSLHPQKLIGLFKKTSIITLANSLVAFIIAFLFALAARFNVTDSICIGLALMFSSTILVVKLLPTTRLHHEKMGAICISILILQDLLAVAVLAFIRGFNLPGPIIGNLGLLFLKLLIFIAIIYLAEQFILRKIMFRIERIHEAIFVASLAWCFGIAIISNYMGLFYETGAFLAGVVLAKHRISLFISESLKPLRDFFLVLFFFTLGAELDLFVMQGILVPSIILALIFIAVKPWLFKRSFIWSGEENAFSKETGVRLGQLSEFSLLVAILAFNLGHITKAASQFIQLVTILTFIVSSYIVTLRYPTPIGPSKQLKKD
jgi:Kef-type K+ transport system membrane component KefB